MPVVTVIMNCLNCARYLREAIDSVYAQTYEDWEIIFWDNASTDDSLEIAKSYGEKVRCFNSKETVSLGMARNWAMEQAKGSYIAFLDCDDVWLPTKIEKQVALFEENPKIGLVYSNAIYFNNKGVSFKLYKDRRLPQGKIFGKLLGKNFLCLSTTVIRKDALSDLNHWFDDRFNVIEERDLFLRIAYKWEVGYVDDVLAKYRMHAQSWTFNKQSLFPLEEKILMSKLKNICPMINEEFNRDFGLAQSKISYNEACLCWLEGEKKKARSLLAPFLKINKKLLFPYMFSYFMPYRFYKYVLRMCGQPVYIS